MKSPNKFHFLIIALLFCTTSVFGITISGSPICIGAATTLSIDTFGGTWSSGNVARATIDPITGVATGLSAGTVVISYNVPGATFTAVMGVVVPPIAISGLSSICEGVTTALSNAMGSGTWSSSDPSTASIGMTSGTLTGVNTGTAIITYTQYTGCITTRVQTINAMPSDFTASPNMYLSFGTRNICLGLTGTLASTPSGGVWTSSTPAIAVVGSSSGIINGIIGGGTTIRYSLPSGCSRAIVVNIINLPLVISGALTVCVGNTTTLSSGTAYGAWTSSTPSVASVVAGTGVVTGISTGTATISYSMATGCIRTAVVTVDPTVSAINGEATICVGSTSILTNATTGGTWLSSNTAKATVGISTGVVTGVSSGTTIISYRLSTGCHNTRQVTVNAAPAPITGTTTFCVGTTTTLSHSTSGGTWSSSNTARATVDTTSGVVTGIASGTVTITYTLTGGCRKTINLAIYPSLLPIGGTGITCEGTSTTMTNVTGGGTWSSSNTNSTIGSSSGIVTGVSAGTTIITYIAPTGCYTSRIVTVNTTPAAISGSAIICSGGSTTFTTTPTGGTWTSTSVSVAGIGSASGLVTGITGGGTTINYVLSTGCRTSRALTVTAAPATITGTATVSIANTTLLSSTSTGGTWSSTNTGVATIAPSTGLVTGVSVGTSLITYTTGVTCYRTKVVTVNPGCSVTSPLSVCSGSTSTLTTPTAGGTWSSSNGAVASIVTSSGALSALTAGTTIISYRTGTCSSAAVLTVNNTPSSITGTDTICEGSATTLSNSVSGGTWASSNTPVATVIAAAGTVTGISAGTATITYGFPGCVSTTVVVVNVAPGTITGAAEVCTDATTELSNSVSGGIWSSSHSAIATIHPSSGMVTGISSGTTTISYTIGACISTKIVSVTATPDPITGTAVLCAGNTTTLASATSGGVWSSTNGTVATIGSGTGIVATLTAGTTLITYTTGCIQSIIFTVNPTPESITGTAMVCVGTTATLASATADGTWSSVSEGVATIGSSTGIATGIAAGTTLISYVLPVGDCYTTRVLTVNNNPAAITGASTLTVAAHITLNSTTTGGVWSSANTSIATVGSATGIVTGVTPGIVTIRYTLTTGCTTLLTISVTSACIGTNIITTFAGTGTLGDGSPGGPATSTRINHPHGITVDASGNVYFTDVQRIRKVNTMGIITNIAGTGINAFSGDNGQATAAQINNAFDLTLDAAGNIYFSDGHNHRIRKISTTGIITTIAGNGTVGYSGDGFAATNAMLTYPGGIALDIAGNIYFADGTHRIRKIDIGTGIITTIAGTGTFGYSGDGGPATAAKFYYANFLHADHSTGDLYVTDNGNHCIRKINSSGIVTTIAGTGVAGSDGDGGPATAARLTYPAGVTKDNSGNIYVSDYSNKKIRRITPDGIIFTFAGTGTAGYSGDGSAATLAMLSESPDVAANASGQLYISDRFNERIRKITGTTDILGTRILCTGGSTTLSSSSSGGTWTSTNTSVATVDSATGIVSGIIAGTSVISYVVSPTCFSTATVTVNTGIAAIGGPSEVCPGFTATQTHASGGGTWSSASTTIATIGSSSGIATGVSAGTAVISYTLSAPGCYATRTLSVHANPATITGTTTINVTASTTLSSATSGGSWSSSNTSVATAGSATGIVSGIAAGTATITYTVATGCYTTTTVSVNSVCSISGTLTICNGATTTLSSVATGGTWTSTNTPIATIGSSSGVVSGVSPGTSVISYNSGAGCTSTAIVTVNTDPGAGVITGPATMPVGSTTTLSSAVAGGTWTSSNPSIATIGSTGFVTAVAPGTAIISYIATNICGTTDTAIHSVTIPPVADDAPAIATLSDYSANAGSTIVLTGNYFNSVPEFNIVQFGAVKGIVTAASTTSLTVTVPVSATYSHIKVTNLSNGLSGFSPYPFLSTFNSTSYYPSVNFNTALLLEPGTGVPNDVTMGDIDGDGKPELVAAVTGGIVISQNIATPGSLTPSSFAPPVFIPSYGRHVRLHDVDGDGKLDIISSQDGMKIHRNISTPGTITTASFEAAVSFPGANSFSFDDVDGDGKTDIVADTYHGVNIFRNISVPGTLSSTSFESPVGYTVGGGNSKGVAVSDIDGDGRKDIAIAQHDPDGIFVFKNTSIPGIVSIATPVSLPVSYGPSGIAMGDINGDGKQDIVVSLYDANPDAYINTGMMDTITASSFGTPEHVVAHYGYYQSVALDDMNGDSDLDVVSGNSWSGAAVVSLIASYPHTSHEFSLGGPLYPEAIISGDLDGDGYPDIVTANPFSGNLSILRNNPISVADAESTLCIGETDTISYTPSGGTWTSTNPAVATIGSTTGIMTGISAGTTFMQYTAPGVFFQKFITVYENPAAIVGAGSVCVGGSVTLTNTTSGGTWASATLATATIGSSTGIATGISAGTTTISYTKTATGCYTTRTLTINATAGAEIGGTPRVCIGRTTTLTSLVSGGTWTSSVTARATVNITTGVVTGVSAGTAVISYTAGGCVSTVIMTVNSNPVALTGTNSVNIGSTTTFSSTTSGGTWSSSNTEVGTVGTSGIITGITAGTSTITYTIPGTTCFVTRNVTVINPCAITGSLISCIDFSSTLSSPISGGTWTSTNTAVATIGSSTGTITGHTAGTTAISYATGGGCTSMAVVTVNSTPGAITGAATVCVNSTTVLGASPAGGTWSSSNTAVGSINSATRTVRGLSAGTVTMSYILSASCYATHTMTINPAAGTISGPSALCMGSSAAFTSDSTGGTWSSSNPTIATVGSATGMVSAISAGAATVSYIMPAGCYATKAITTESTLVINPTYGPLSVEVGKHIALFNFNGEPELPVETTYPANYWVVSNTAVATLDHTSYDGMNSLTGVSAGTVSILYITANSCGSDTTTKIVTAIEPSCPKVLEFAGGGNNFANTEVNFPDHVSVTTGRDGTPVVAYSSNGKIYVRSYARDKFAPLGDSTFYWVGDGNGQEPCVAVDDSGYVYVAYGLSGNVIVKRYNGKQWLFVGSPVVGFPYIYLTISNENELYLSHKNSNPGSIPGDSICVSKFNGTDWVSLGTTGLTSYVHRHGFDVAADGTPFIAGSEDGSSITVKKYSAGSWSTVGEEPAVPGLGVESLSLAVDPAGIPYFNYGSSIGKFEGGTFHDIGTYDFDLGTGDYKRNLKFDKSGNLYLLPVGGSFEKGRLIKYDGASWSYLGGEIAEMTIESSSYYSDMSSFAIDKSGKPYVTAIENYNKISTYSLDGSAWKPMSANNEISDGFCYLNAMIMDVDTAIVAYADELHDNKAIVKKLVGNHWEYVGTPGFSAGSVSAISLAKSPAGNLYVAYADGSAGAKVTVKRFNGSNWVTVGSAAFSAGAAEYLNIVMANDGTPYVSYKDGGNAGKATVMKYSGSWSAVGAPGLSVAAVNSLSMDISSTNTPYIAYRTGSVLYTSRFNGSTWEMVGSTFPASTYSGYREAKIKLDNSDIPHVIYSNPYSLRVMRYDGMNWVLFGGPSILASNNDVGYGYDPSTIDFLAQTISPSLTFDNANVAYVSYGYSPEYLAAGFGGRLAYVCKYDGSDWVEVSRGLFKNVQDVQVAVTNTGVPHIACTQKPVQDGYDPNVYSFRLAVVKYTDNSIKGNLAVCPGYISYLTTIDTTNGTWSSSNTSVASINAFGLVTGIAPGTTTISYNASGCIITTVVTVNEAPAAGTLSGTTTVVEGGTTTFASTITGGVWSTGNPAVATVSAALGVVTGVATGTATITYAHANSCGLAIATRTVNVTAARPETTAGGQSVFMVYPNPTSGSLSVESAIEGTVKVSTIDGREIKEYKISKGSTQLALPAELTAGIYMFRFAGNDGSSNIVRLVYEPQ